MIELLKKIIANKKARYLTVGAVSFTIEYLVFTILHLTGLGIYLSNTISFIVGLSISFLAHKYWSFSGQQQLRESMQMAWYTSLAMANLIIVNILIGIFVWMEVDPLVAKIYAMVIIVLWNFLVLDRIIFRNKR